MYTLECSLNGGLDNEGNFEEYCPDDYKEFGRSFCVALSKMTDSSEIICEQYPTLESIKNWVNKRLIAEGIRLSARKMMLEKLKMKKASVTGKSTKEGAE